MKLSVGVLIALVVVLVAGNLVMFTVTEIEQAVVLQFGQPVRTITDPGLYFKLPNPIQDVAVFDKRLLEYDSAPEPIYTNDKKILVVDNYARWRIVDPLKFRETLLTEAGGRDRLDDIIYSELRKELGQHTLSEVVSENRQALMELVTQRSDEAGRDYGIAVVDVRIKRADLPPENETAVFNRMRAERAREAKAYRSEGEEEALKIRAETDLQAASIRAEAAEEAQRSRGQGDAEALRIYAAAYQGAEEFYGFTRTLEAYEASLKENATLVLPADSEFFRFLKGTP
jgi:modulator of FtsH protease HflC